MTKDTINEKEEILIEMVSDFCDAELNEDYKNLAVDLVKKMGNKQDVPFKRGKLEIWASGVIYALGQNNFLFEKDCEPYKTPDDICNYFNTNKSTVSRKAKTIRDMFDMNHENKEFLITPTKETEPESSVNKEEVIDNSDIVSEISSNDYLDNKNQSLERNFDDDSIEKVKKLLEENGEVDENKINEILDSLSNPMDYSSDFTSIKEYENAIEKFKREKGDKYFEENKGAFWGLVETRPFMQNVLDYAWLLWHSGKKEKAIKNMEYLIELNPADNQGVRWPLINFYINTNKLDDATKLIDYFSDDSGAFTNYSRLLVAIKNKEKKSQIKHLYKKAFEQNPHVIDYILNKKQVDEYPEFYMAGEESEAKFYQIMSLNNWKDKRALKFLRKLVNK